MIDAPKIDAFSKISRNFSKKPQVFVHFHPSQYINLTHFDWSLFQTPRNMTAHIYFDNSGEILEYLFLMKWHKDIELCHLFHLELTP